MFLFQLAIGSTVEKEGAVRIEHIHTHVNAIQATPISSISLLSPATVIVCTIIYMLIFSF